MKKLSFTKEQAEIVKGIAILLMLVHHLFGFPDWYQEGVSYIGIPLRTNTLEYVVAQFGHICVSIFAFITGYGMFFSYRSGSVIKKSVRKGTTFLIGYWLVLFLVAIPVNLMLGKKDITVSLVLNNLFGYDNTLVSFAWYVRFYLEMLITLPLFCYMLTKFQWMAIPVFFIIPVLANCLMGTISSSNVFIGKIVYFSMEYFLWITPVLMGLCFARYGLFEKLGKLFSKTGKMEHLVSIVLMILLMYLRAYRKDTIGSVFSFDCIYAPLFVFLAVRIVEMIPSMGIFLKFIGTYSMNIWFLHSIFFFRTAELMKYIYAPRIPLFILLWTVLLCLPVSWVLSKVMNLMVGNRSKRREESIGKVIVQETKQSAEILTMGEKTN